MALEQYFSHGWRRVPAATAKDCFDCNICLAFVSEPVVTLCGHLYCWPCIYKWLQVQSASHAAPQCPVCKADISHTSMVPLYGGDHSAEDAEIDDGDGNGNRLAIPPRPSACGNKALASISANAYDQQLPYSNPYRNPNYYFDLYDDYEEDSGASLFNLESNPYPTVGIFGELVYARVFGESLYAYPNSYGSSNHQMRRQEMQADKSLNRLSFFLFCCVVLCLVFF